MKKSKQRLCAALLAALTVFTSVFSGITNVMAASSSSNLKLWYASNKEHGVVTEFNSYTYTGNIMYGMLDGSTAYCMNYAKSADGGQKMQSSSQPKTTLSQEQEKQLGYCMHYGHARTTEGAPTNAERNAFIATQAMVWIIEKGLFGTDKADAAAKKLCACAPSSTEAYDAYILLRENMETAMNATVPSFAASTEKDATVYELKWNESNNRFEVNLNDTNGAIKDFDFKGSGLGLSKNGNQLTIYTDSVNTEPMVVTGTTNNGTVQLADSCVYWTVDKEKYQEFVSSRPEVSPFYAYFKVKTESLGYAQLIKKDKETGVALPHTKFGIYSDSTCSNQIEKLTTDAKGIAISKALTTGTYYVKELEVPKGYLLSEDIHTLVIEAGKTVSLHIVNQAQKGALTIYKEGEVLSQWDGQNFIYKTKKLSGARFQVKAGDDIYRADGTKVYTKGDVVAKELTTGADGYVMLSDLHLGTYVVTETGTPQGYIINGTPHVVKIETEDQHVRIQYESTTVRNDRQKADVRVVKKDVDTSNPLKGGQYTIYAADNIVNSDGKIIVSKGKALQTATSNEYGEAIFTVDLPVANNYYVKETSAPHGYVKNQKETYEFRFDYLSGKEEKKTFQHTFFNERVTARIHLSKVDADTGTALPQGDATLTGAEYGLYARKDILHPDGKTGVLFKANDLVATLTTDEDGKDEVRNLYLGHYYIKEILPSKGYTLDVKEYDLQCDYQGDLVAEVIKSTVSYENVIRQPFQLIKISDNGTETNAPLVEGAGFQAYLKSALSMKQDGSYDFENATSIEIGSGGETELFSDSKGSVLTIPIPYGTYVVVESTTPHNMAPVKPFEITISENKPNEPQVWRVLIDREFTAKLRIVKTDSDTGQNVLVPKAEFKIYDIDKKEYVSMTTTYPSKVTHTSFLTDEDGDLILPNSLKVGNYRIEEVTAPYGYVQNTNYVSVAIDSNTFYEVDPETNEAIITVKYENEPVRGKLIIEKKGDVLCDYKDGLFTPLEKKQFEYKEVALAGVTFEIYANEDVYTADMQLDVNGNRIKYYAKNELVATLITDEEGMATLTDLPLGSYRLIEVEAPYGYVAEKEEKIVTFDYVNDQISMIEESLVIPNKRQKLQLGIDKKDIETKESVSGAVFGLYASEDVLNIDGKVIVESETLLETAMSDEYGKVSFVKDYPFGRYYAKEIEAPSGYVSSDEIVRFDATYQGQDIEVATYNQVFFNAPTTVEFIKTDLTSGAELDGATLTVLDCDGHIIDTWTSQACEPHVIQRLVVGNTYILREEYAPYGYLKATDISFTIKDTDQVQKVNMKDEVPVGTIIVNKDGEILTDIESTKNHWYDVIFHFFRDSLEGVVFEVYAEEDIVSPDGLGSILYQKDELVSTIVTNAKGIAMIEGLPMGDYYLIEAKTLDGFVMDRQPIKAKLHYVDQDTSVVYAEMDVTNDRKHVQITITKKDAETEALLEGAMFGLYAKEDIVNKNGKVLLAADSRIEKGVTGKDGKITFVSDLPLGMYYIKEIEAPFGYVKSDEIVVVDVSGKETNREIVTFETEFLNYPEMPESPKTSDEAYLLLWGGHGVIALGICIGTWIHLWKRNRTMRRS